LLHDETLAVICAHVARRDGVLFSGVATTLSALREAGYVLAVASNGRRRYIETVLATYDIARNFRELISADEVGNKTALLRAYLERIPALPDNTVMVGDRASDVEAAVTNRCRFVGCDYGHGYVDEIASAGPMVSRFDELPGVIATILDR
jgi:phosphoglycolate phosphatase